MAKKPSGFMARFEKSAADRRKDSKKGIPREGSRAEEAMDRRVAKKAMFKKGKK